MPNPLEYATKRLAEIQKTHPGTGPRTEEGKRRSSQNAIRHGLSGRVVVLPSEDTNLYLDFTKNFIESLKPATPTEHELAQNIADGYWRLKRVRTAEESLYALGYNEGESDLDDAISTGKTFRDHSKAFVNLSIYEQRIQRGIEKNTKLLRELQAERKATEPTNAPPPTKPKQTKPVAINEFVCSTPEPTKPPILDEDENAPGTALL